MSPWWSIDALTHACSSTCELDLGPCSSSKHGNLLEPSMWPSLVFKWLWLQISSAYGSRSLKELTQGCSLIEGLRAHCQWVLVTAKSGCILGKGLRVHCQWVLVTVHPGSGLKTLL